MHLGGRKPTGPNVIPLATEVPHQQEAAKRNNAPGKPAPQRSSRYASRQDVAANHPDTRCHEKRQRHPQAEGPAQPPRGPFAANSAAGVRRSQRCLPTHWVEYGSRGGPPRGYRSRRLAPWPVARLWLILTPTGPPPSLDGHKERDEPRSAPLPPPGTGQAPQGFAEPPPSGTHSATHRRGIHPRRNGCSRN